MTAPEGESVLQVSVKRHVLHSSLAKASGVIPSKEIMPVLKNFLIEATLGVGAGPSRVRVTASDLELSVVSTMELAKVQVPGRVVLPAKRMLEISNTAAGEDVTIDVIAGTAIVTSGAASWTIKLADGSDYPQMPELADIQLYDIDRGKFLNGLSSVRYAASSSRSDLSLINVSDGVVTACDGVRFQQAQLGDPFPLSIQIPISAVDDIVKMLRFHGDVAVISVGESENHIVFRISGDVFVANKMMAQFPDVETQLLGQARNNHDELRIDREDLLNVIKRVRINADPESSAIALSLSADQLVLSSRDKFGNSCYETITASWDLAPRVLVVNHKFLTDMLNMYDGPSCRLLLGPDITKTKKSPVMLRDETTGAIGLIQQMRADFVID